VHGTMRRHRETAETCVAAAGWGAVPTIDAGWDEFDFLSVLALHAHEYGPEPTKAEFQRLFEEATEAWMAGTDRPYDETFAAFADRVHGALERTVELASAGTVAVFTSGGPIGLAVAEVLADPATLATQLPGLWGRLNRMSVNAALTRVVSGSTGLNLLTYNDQSHLDAVNGAVTYR
jgi:broad specificity phosphatase PhoE